MDEAIIKYYRSLSRTGFRHTGSLENPSILLTDKSGQRIRVCTNIGSYVNIYIDVQNEVIKTVKYLCTCNPATHVAVELMCSLLENKSLNEALSLTDKSFMQILGGDSEELRQKAKSLLELLKSGIVQYHNARL